ncbi:MAG: glycosyltransferase family 4 protein [Deltaproteobacteria bacterium]|nr:glycosyltransferase family 4 protein [Deltaproteobacteria bacterium]
MALARLGMLARFCTDVYVRSRTASRIFEAWGLHSLAGRHHGELPSECVELFPSVLVKERISNRRSVAQARTWIQRGVRFGEAVAAAGFFDANVSYAYTSAALEIFARARALGLATMLDHATAPMVPEMDLVESAARSWPDSFDMPPRPSAEHEYFERQRNEWSSADTIVCNSSFLRRMIVSAGGPADRCVIVPLGIDARFLPRPPRAPGGLRVVFVGDDGLRKGLPDFVRACSLAGIRRSEARVAGAISMTSSGRARAEASVELLGRLGRRELARLLGWADVLVLPSVSDTFGMVVLEAMALGCVPITTPNAGAADVIVDGESGFIVPVHAPDRIAEILTRLATDTTHLEGASRAAQLRARDFDVSRYGERLAAAAAETLSRRRS